MTNEIVKTFHLQLKKYIQYRIHNAEDAEDILQDVYLKIHTKSASLQNREKLQAWLFQIVRNTIIDYYRKKKPTFDIDDAQDIPMLEVQQQRAEKLATCIEPLIHTLPEKYRQALLLTDIEGMPQTKLAEALGLSASGAKSRVQRARQKLRYAIQTCCEIKHDSRGNILDYKVREQSC